MIIYILSFVAIVYSSLYFMAKYFEEAKCPECKMYGEKKYMINVSSDKYYHSSCYSHRLFN
jgi:hypothetical protein